jgi:CBS domain-containing protein
MNAFDVMAPNIVTIQDDASVEEAAWLMLQDGINALPVVDRRGALIGIVTADDFRRRARDRTGTFSLRDVGSDARKVSEVMTREVITVSEDASLENVATAMDRHGVRHVVVMRGGTLVGMIDRGNLRQAQAMMPSRAVAEADREIRQEIIAEFEALAWMPSASVNPIVWDGVVHLHGCVRHERERAALKFIAKCPPGVVDVEDHLVQVEPYPYMTFRGPARFSPDRDAYVGCA